MWTSTRKERVMTPEQKRGFIESVRQYNKLGETIYRETKLSEVMENIGAIVENAKVITIKESEGSFDRIVVERHMKQLDEAFRLFEKSGMEISQGQQRLEACYEEIGSILGKYYEIFDLDTTDPGLADMVPDDVKEPELRQESSKLSKESSDKSFGKNAKSISSDAKYFKLNGKICSQGKVNQLARSVSSTYVDQISHLVEDGEVLKLKGFGTIQRISYP